MLAAADAYDADAVDDPLDDADAVDDPLGNTVFVATLLLAMAAFAEFTMILVLSTSFGIFGSFEAVLVGDFVLPARFFAGSLFGDLLLSSSSPLK